MGDQVKVSQHDMSSGKVLSGGPGIVVLSPSMKILHLNRQARFLINGLASFTEDLPECPAQKGGVEWQPVAKRR